MVAAAARERGYRFPVLIDEAGDALRAYGVTLRPTTAIIGPEGNVRAMRAGAHSAAAWREQLARHRLAPER